MQAPKAHDVTFYQDILRIIRANGIILPFVVVIAGLLIKFGVLGQESYVNDWWFAGISIGFVATALAYYATPTLSPNQYAAFTFVYHSLAVLFLACISGVASPFVVLWLVLFVGVDDYFGGRSIIFSMSMLTTAGLLDLFIHPEHSSQHQIAIVLTIVFMTVVCSTMAKLRAVGEHERIDLAKAHDREVFDRDRLVSLVNSIGDAVISTNERGVIKVYNSAALSLLDTHSGLDDKQFNRNIRLFDESGQKVDILGQARTDKAGFIRNDLSLHFDDETVDVSVSVSPIRLNYHTRGESGFIFIMRDITKQKSLEEERDEFISVVSHELRTPVAIAEGNVSNVRLLRQKGMPPAAIDRALDETHQQIMYLAKMINDLSTLSRAERGLDAAPEPIDLHTLLNDLYRNYLPKAAEKKLRLDLDVSGHLPAVASSRLYLQEILQNLITNAIKYTKSGSITLGAKVNKDGIRLTVTDTGIGISRADQKHIFQKFYRSEDYRTRESSGTGLGLYVSKKLAAKIGAELSFVSRLNHGTTFTLYMPNPETAD